MADGKGLTEDFAARFPAEFARVLAQGDIAEVASILADLPQPLASSVASKLPAQLLLQLVSWEGSDPTPWLAGASVDDAIAMLGRLPRDRSLAMVNGLADRRRRRRLLQHLNYPSHSVGALVTDVGLRFAISEPVDQLLGEIRKTGGCVEQPVAIIDENERYAGVIDLWKLAVAANGSENAGGVSKRPTPLRPELPIPSALTASAWKNNTWLPVVDADRRLLGAVYRATLEKAAIGLSPEQDIDRPTVGTLASGFIAVLGDAIAGLLGPGKAR